LGTSVSNSSSPGIFENNYAEGEVIVHNPDLMASFDLLRCFNEETADAIERDLLWLEDYDFEHSKWPGSIRYPGNRKRNRKCGTREKQSRLCCIFFKEYLLNLPKSQRPKGVKWTDRDYY
jgi:hypothetical protein